jgi:hypothetical protein
MAAMAMVNPTSPLVLPQLAETQVPVNDEQSTSQRMTKMKTQQREKKKKKKTKTTIKTKTEAHDTSTDDQELEA